MFEEVSTSVASSRTCGNIIQVMKFNWIEFLGEHICYKKDASACLPSRSLLYFLILTKHICIPISKATVLPREYLLYSEDSHPFLLHVLIYTFFTQSLSFLLLPFILLLSWTFYLFSHIQPKKQWAPVVPLPSQCYGGVALAFHHQHP